MSLTKNDSSNPVSIWNPRYKRNVYLYMVIYGLLGFATGVTNNTLISYLDLTANKVVTGMAMYSAFSSLLLAILLVWIKHIGYKKMLLLVSILSVLSLLVFNVTHTFWLMVLAYIIMGTGLSMYDCVYPLMYFVYTPQDRRTKYFTAVMMINLITQAIMTFFGGKIVVAVFAHMIHVPYATADTISADTEKMSGTILSIYEQSYKSVIWIALCFVVIAFVIALFLKEKKEDYQETVEERAIRHAQSQQFTIKDLINRDVVCWLIFVILSAFGAALVTPYFPIFLSHYLHIARGMVSTIVSLQTLAMFIGYFFADWLEKKLGSVIAIAGAAIICIPLMLLMPNIGHIAKAISISVVMTVGIILFLRSGVANMTTPVKQAFQMYLVSKDYRPAFSSLMTILTAALGIIEGLFTEYVLFTTPQGYAIAYYIASGCYLVASVFLIVTMRKKYNRITQNQHTEDTTEQTEKQN